MNPATKEYDPFTTAVHASKQEGAMGVVNSVEPSSAFHYIDEGVQLYPRYFNTPNQQIVTKQICDLEKAETGVAFSSGMAAISTTLMALAAPGDHVVFQKALYGGTHSLVVNEFANAGIQYTFANSNAESMLDSLRPNTKIVYIETPANPLMNVIDIAKLTGNIPSGIYTVCDNTFASPINQQPISLGVDVVVHSGTKYLGGHSDLSFGAAVGSSKAVDHVREKASRLGSNLNAMTCYLIERSIKTLAVRVHKQNSNAHCIAEHLSRHRNVDRVHYPGLPAHKDHSIAKSQMHGFGGMLSFELNNSMVVREFLAALQLIAPAMSLGAVETTVTAPALTSHRPMPKQDRLAIGINDQLVRMSVGIESPDDLIRDLEQALDHCERADRQAT